MVVTFEFALCPIYKLLIHQGCSPVSQERYMRGTPNRGYILLLDYTQEVHDGLRGWCSVYGWMGFEVGYLSTILVARLCHS